MTVSHGRRRCALALAVVVPLVLATASCSQPADGGPSINASPSAASSDEARSAVNGLIATGLEQLANKQYPEATSTFETVLNLDPVNQYAWYNLGYIAQLNGDDGTAIDRYSSALEANPDFTQALYNLAILTEPSALAVSVDMYRRIIVLSPDNATAYMRLGYALVHLGKVKEGEKMLAKARTLDPSLVGVPSPTYS